MIIPIVLALVFLLPGAALTWVRLRLERRTEVPFVQALIEMLLSSTAIASMVMIVLLELESFRLTPLAWTLAVITALIATPGLIRTPRPSLTFRWAEAGWLLIILSLFLVLTFPPFNYAIGGTDPGMYVVGGNQIARTGHVHLEVPTLSATPPGLFWQNQSIIAPEDLPPSLRSTGGLIEKHYEGIWTSAMFVTDSDRGRVVPQFLHLWMLWIALFVSLMGGAQSVVALPILAALGVLAFYGAAREAFGATRPAFVSLLFLAFNWTFIYFSRLPVSEMVAFFYLAGGLWAIARFTRTKSVVHAALGGAFFGLSLFTRLDLLYQLPAFVLLFSVLYVTRGLHWRWMVFFGSVAGMIGWAFFHNLSYSWPYMFSQLCYVGVGQRLTVEHMIFAVISFFIATVCLLIGRRLAIRWHGDSRSAPDQLFRIASIALAVFFATFILYDSFPAFPLISTKGVVSDWAENETISRFILAIGLPGLLFGLAGACESLRRKGRDIAILFALFLLIDVWLIHTLVRATWLVVPYGLRYYSADLLPLLSFFGGWMASAVADRIQSPRWRSLALVGLCGAALLPSMIVTTRLATYEGMHRTFRDLSNLASHIEPTGVVLFDQSNSLRAFQSPLVTIFGVESHTVSGKSNDLLQRWIEDEPRPVYLVGGHDLLHYAGIPLDHISAGSLTVTEVQQVGQYRHLNLHWYDWNGEYSLYRFRPASE